MRVNIPCVLVQIDKIVPLYGTIAAISIFKSCCYVTIYITTNDLARFFRAYSYKYPVNIYHLMEQGTNKVILRSCYINNISISQENEQKSTIVICNHGNLTTSFHNWYRKHVTPSSSCNP